MKEQRADQNRVWLAALAGLLHDVGKFTGRAGVGTAIDNKREQKEIGYWHAEHSQTFVDNYVPPKFRTGVGVVRYHHRPDNVPAESVEVRALCKSVRLADRWSAGERTTGKPERSAPSHTPLVPILSRVRLAMEPSGEHWKHRIQACELSKESLFPVNIEEESLGDVSAQYEGLWDKAMRPEIDAWRGEKNWEKQSLESYLITLLALLQKYLTFVPSATPWQADEDDRVIPDVSLFDHLKTTAAIAACLRAGFSDEEILAFEGQDNRPVALLVRGDFSGIQSFIYRITRPDDERTFREAARRLRGRSFYLGLLGEAIAHQLLEWLGLPPTNLLFCGGGRFDILVPRNAQGTIETAQKRLEEWLLREFHGELAMVMAWEPVSPQDLANMRKVYLTLEARLDERKERKWQRFLDSPDFFVSTKDEWEACPVCKLQATAGICDQCDLHARIGRLLPRADYLVLTPDRPTWQDRETEVLTVPFDFGDGAIYAALMTASAAHKLLPMLTDGVVYRLNNTDFRCDDWPRLGQGFRFLANTVPQVPEGDERLVLPGRPNEEAVEPGQGLDFEEIAYLSTGSKKLGVLKADVDHLGLLFSEGIEPLTISRLASLSGAIDRFFSGYINVLASTVSGEWKTAEGREHPWCGKVSGLFYVAYSGGDDLFVIGPWDAVMTLAQRLEAEWREYACENPNVTISAGIALFNPHHPIQRMAATVNAAEKRAKSDGRQRINIFAQSVLWQPNDPEPSFGQLLEYARRLANAVGEHSLPRSFVHYVGWLYEEHFKRKKVNGKPNLMFLPKLYYAVKRRVRKEVAESLELTDTLWKRKMMWYAPVLVSYVSLITRKE